jgi:cytochrome c oxidase assembly factor CtaG
MMMMMMMMMIMLLFVLGSNRTTALEQIGSKQPYVPLRSVCSEFPLEHLVVVVVVVVVVQLITSE